MNTLINVGLEILMIGAILGLFVWAIDKLFHEPYKTWATVVLVVIAGIMLIGIAFGLHGSSHGAIGNLH